jgi:CheY-like chemotaxis protein
MPIAEARPTVLYVEDHPVNAMLMEALFRRRPALRLVVASTGAEALAAVETIRPALLLLDLNLPDTHGTRLLGALRRVPGCEHAPAVAVTADVTCDIRGFGFDERWTKPLDLLHVLDRVDALTAPAWLANASSEAAAG